MPEEQNRRLTDNLATWLFCPTGAAIDNLRRENIIDCGSNVKPSADKKRVVMSGDIMYEASLYYRAKSSITIKEKDFILLTIHRAENTDDPRRLRSIVEAINHTDNCQFIFPVHPRTRKILEREKLVFAGHVRLIEPAGYLEMLGFEASCSAVLTDSGGVQKEAFFFKKPCITMRDSTEWVELVDSGWNTLSGADTDRIVSALQNITIPVDYPALYGDGHCAEKIIAVLK
jgi:UDP-GlcNAc3NAcA epimerase